MKKIGFVDLYISEWHANNYPAWIKSAAEKLGMDYKVAYAWAMEAVSPVDGRTTDEWCEAFGVEKCDTLEELCEKSDVILLLAPSNPEVHLALAERVFPFGKPTYVDKTFAPDLDTAKRIFELGETYGTPFFSTSALRYAKEIGEFMGAKNLLLTGGGSNLPEYVIHLVEMAVTLVKNPMKRVKCEPVGRQVLIRVEGDENQLMMVYSPALGYSVCGEFADGKLVKKDVGSEFFPNLIEDILVFFETGKLPFDPRETLEVMRIRDGILAACDSPETWIQI
ncbi:MAG: hypothetical protein E7428_05065 [Ruminococcaceae bacterium]|nr:hypothetical protein [Oscillospiraceae bacterium]